VVGMLDALWVSSTSDLSISSLETGVLRYGEETLNLTSMEATYSSATQLTAPSSFTGLNTGTTELTELAIPTSNVVDLKAVTSSSFYNWN